MTQKGREGRERGREGVHMVDGWMEGRAHIEKLKGAFNETMPP